MKPIAVTTLPGNRRDVFWLDTGFGMVASSPGRLDSNLHLGGIFTSVPAAVAAMVRPKPVFSTAEAMWIGAAAPLIRTDARANEPVTAVKAPVSGTLLDPGGIQPLTQRIDVFGLGLDYAMYHKRLWGNFHQDDFVGWQRLGGIFMSAPSAIVWADSRLDVFGVGLDHAMYVKTCIGEQFTPEWVSLGGAFTSSAALLSRRPQLLDLFARGSDFTLRGNHTDGTTWFGWQNHGGKLASPPVAVSWGPDRMDIFAIFDNGALWHRWWDGQIWNDWESLGGQYTGEPAAVAWAPGRLDVFVIGAPNRGIHHYSFSNGTWSLPEPLYIGSTSGLAGTPTVISLAANHLELFAPTDDHNIRIGKWDGQRWSFEAAGGTCRVPQRYRISVDLVRVNTTRALDSDTDAAMISVAAGNAAAVIKTQWIGDIGGLTNPKTSQTNLLEVDPVTVDLAEPMSFSYLVVNNGHAPEEKVLAALATAGDSLSIAGSSSMQEDIAKGIVKIITVKIISAIAISIPVIGSVLGAIESWLMGKLTKAAFESCDGVVAVELRAMLGRDLYILTDNGRKTVTVTTTHKGTESPTGCGANSNYEVTWTIKPL